MRLMQCESAQAHCRRRSSFPGKCIAGGLGEGSKPMDIYAALKKDHEKVQGLLDQLVRTSETDDQSWKSLLDQIRDEVIPHSRAEEAVFYNSLRSTGHLQAKLLDSYREHAMVETEIRALQALKRFDVNWTKAVEKLKKDLVRHIEEEEQKVFSEARKVFSEEECNKLGEAFLRLKAEAEKDAKSFTRSTIDMVANLLPQRFVEGFKKLLGGEKKAA